MLAKLALRLLCHVAANRIRVLPEKRPTHLTVELLDGGNRIRHQLGEVQIDDAIRQLACCAPACQQEHQIAQALEDRAPGGRVLSSVTGTGNNSWPALPNATRAGEIP